MLIFNVQMRLSWEAINSLIWAEFTASNSTASISLDQLVSHVLRRTAMAVFVGKDLTIWIEHRVFLSRIWENNSHLLRSYLAVEVYVVIIIVKPTRWIIFLVESLKSLRPLLLSKLETQFKPIHERDIKH